MIHTTRPPIAACLRLMALLFGLLACVPIVRADVTLPRIFGSHMVLERGRELPVWGKAAPGEKVTVLLGDKGGSATADEQGKWMVRLPPLPAGGPFTMTVKGNNTIMLDDVLVGEVWVCSGQSNMEWPVSKSDNAEQEIAAADHPRIRLFHVERKKADSEQADVQGAWQICTPETVATFSAVAYYFGRDLEQRLDVPIGLIQSAWGGTPAEHWTPQAAFAADPSLAETSQHPHAQNVMQTPSVLYNGMIAPLAPFAIQGVIWYQGESNVPMADHYKKLFTSMISSWRRAWGQGDFPFLYVQIAPWKYENIKDWPTGASPRLREAQLKSLELKNTAMVVTMDIGDVDDIHPTNKQEVGRRLALAARALAYGEDLVYSGPIFKSMQIDGNKCTLQFDQAAGGLASKSGDLNGFEIAGEDRKFVPAVAQIKGETVVVESAEVPKPVAVRYAWKDDAQPNLFNAAGLPASPFRTDDWK